MRQKQKNYDGITNYFASLYTYRTDILQDKYCREQNLNIKLQDLLKLVLYFILLK